jgi:hypothetical protein
MSINFLFSEPNWITPYLLSNRIDWERMFESIVCFGLQILIGQVLLVGWLPNSIDLFTQTYWLFLFVFWAAYRLGWQGVAFVIVIAGVQAFYGGLHGVGVFGNDFVQTYGLKTVIPTEFGCLFQRPSKQHRDCQFHD